MRELPETQRSAFFEMIGYQIMASYQMNRKFLMAQLHHELIKKGKAAQANWAARQTEEAFDSIASLNNTYNSIEGGKWRGMMNLAPGWCALYQNMPEVLRTDKEEEEPEDMNVNPDESQNCCVIKLSDIKNKIETDGHKINLIRGIGYDWQSLQLGKPTDKMGDATNMNGDRAEYDLPFINQDSIEVTLYTVPFFPIYKGRGTTIGVSVDGCEPQVFKNDFKESSLRWNNQVLRNGAVIKGMFPLEKLKSTHTISFICGDPGMLIQKVIVDWGGLKKSYLGPQK